MKNIKKLIITMSYIILLTGCSASESISNHASNIENNNIVDSKMFQMVSEEFVFDMGTKLVVFYDKETKAMYMYIGNSSAKTVTILINADGTPKLWNGSNY